MKIEPLLALGIAATVLLSVLTFMERHHMLAHLLVRLAA